MDISILGFVASLIGAFMVGGLFGVAALCIVVASKDDYDD